MSERTERIKRALHGCAEAGMSDLANPWPSIRESASKSTPGPLGSRRRSRLAPSTRLGWAFAVLMMMLAFGTGAYAASEIAYELFRQNLPGIEEGEKADAPLHQRGGDAIGSLDTSKTAHGARMILERAYTDENNVVVSFSVEDLRGARRVDGRPAQLQAGPVSLIDEDGNNLESEVSWEGGPERPDRITEGPIGYSAVLKPSEEIDPSEKHRFRIAIPLEKIELLPPESPKVGMLGFETVGEPFVFEFDAPVQRVPVIEMNQRVEANGLTLTLDRVINSPGRPKAIVCFKPPIGGHEWLPSFGEPFPGETGTVRDGYGCMPVTLPEKQEGGYSITITRLDGLPLTKEGGIDPGRPDEVRKIQGPWKFEVPEH